MKKVLALVLAVIMVCTMAMAVQVGGATGYTPATTPDSNAVRMNYIVPGMSLVFDAAELNATGMKKATDYKVEVTFDKGAELVASQGWVETAEGVFVYAINTKTNATAVQDDKADIVISAIKVTKLGQKDPVLNAKYVSKNAEKETTYAYAATAYGEVPANIASGLGYEKLDVKVADFEGNTFAFAWDYGYFHDELTINDEMTLPTVYENTIYTIKKGDVSSVDVVTKDTTNGVQFVYNLKAGDKVSFVQLGTLADLTTKAKKALDDNADAKEANYAAVAALEGAFVPAEKAVTIYVDGQKDGAALYVVDAKGTVKDLGSKFDANKVLTATAKLDGVVILSDKALTTTTAETGTTTNPGTGANDVVGVAAALAVVALVSGAAISLKK